MLNRVFAVATSLFLGCAMVDSPEISSTEESLTGAQIEASNQHPWVVNFGGCRGVLIHPRWALTAAHCKGQYLATGMATLARTNPSTGADQSITTYFDPVNGVFTAPGFDPVNLSHDLALVYLYPPVPITTIYQTAALPRTPRIPDFMGTFARTGAVSSEALVVRTPVLAQNPPNCAQEGGFCLEPAAPVQFCSGDSGTEFTTIVNGRVTVTGITSFHTQSLEDCGPPGAPVGMADVYEHVPWITATIGLTVDGIEGTARVHSTGEPSLGQLSLSCDITLSGITTTLVASGPMNVVGAQIGLPCFVPGAQVSTVDAQCATSSGEGKSFNSFTRTTTTSSGSTTIAQGFTTHLAHASATVPAGTTRSWACNVYDSGGGIH